MSKEQVLDIRFDYVPDVRIRVIEDSDTEPTKQAKIKFPFELFNTVTVNVYTGISSKETDTSGNVIKKIIPIRNFKFNIYKGYTWNGADIPRFLWRLIGSRTSNEFLIASMLHDYMLQFKKYLINEVLKNQITVSEYRRLTSLIFREKLKHQGVNTIKANIMSWAVDVFQHYGNKRGWKIQ